ncbi:MAG TPA: hypothetical protein VEY88_21650, partial [Archangium sp.]|nr:hypothetical protein [Archangium sp.]
GTAWGGCEGSVLPTTETCLNTFDEDCDGQSNEGCGCGMPCYTGPSGTNGVGVCRAGTTQCNVMGTNPYCKGQRLPTPDRCGTPEDDDCNSLTFCTTPINQVLRAGDASCQEATGIIRSGDSLFVSGSFSGSLDLGHGTVLTSSTARSLFVAKLDKNTLAPVWVRTLETTDPLAYFGFMLDDSGQLLLLGKFSGRLTLGASTLVSAYDDYQGDGFLAKLDGASGEPLWLNHLQRTTQGSSLYFQFNQWDTAGNLMLKGNFRGAFTLGGTSLSGNGSFYASLDHTSGQLRWLHHPRSSNGDSHISAEHWDADGDVLLWGSFKGNLTLGSTTLTSTSGYDYFMAKLGGSSSWLTHVDKVRGDIWVRNLAWDAAGDIVLAGGLNGELLIGGTRVSTYFNGYYDQFTAKLQGDSGAVRWVFQPRLEQRVEPAHPIREPSGDVFEAGLFMNDLVLGGTRLSNPLGQDFFVARLQGASGTPRWVSHFQATNGAVHGATYERDADGHILVTGSFSGTLTVGGKTFVVPTDIPSRFLAKLDGATGTLLWATHFRASTPPGYSNLPSVKRDAQGHLLVTAPFEGSLTLGDRTLDGRGDFFAVLDGATGEPRLFSHFQSSSSGNYYFDEMERDASGNLLLTGVFTGELTFGDTTLNGAGRFFVWLDGTTGTPLRYHHLAGTGSIHTGLPRQDAQGNLLLTGVFTGEFTVGDTTISNPQDYRFFAAKLGESSSWLMYPQSTENFQLLDFTWDPSGNLLLHGFFTGDLLLGGTTPHASTGGLFVTEIRHDTGAPAWVQHLGWDRFSFSNIQVEPTGEIFLVGALTGTVQVDGAPPVTSAGCSDFFLGKIPAAY